MEDGTEIETLDAQHGKVEYERERKRKKEAIINIQLGDIPFIPGPVS